MNRIIISYAREDRSAAENLDEELKRNKLSPWIDAVDLRPGQIGRMGLLVIIEADPHKCDDSRENLSFRIESADHSYSR